MYEKQVMVYLYDSSVISILCIGWRRTWLLAFSTHPSTHSVCKY